MLKKIEIDIDSYIKKISDRKIIYEENVAYIMPEFSDGEFDVLNEYTPDLIKDLRNIGIKSIAVKGEKYTYKAFRSADIILPLIFGIPFAVIANFLTDWLQKNIEKNKTVSVRVIRKEEEKYEEVVVEGTGEKVTEILNNLKRF